MIKWGDNSPDTITDDGIMINDCMYRLRYRAVWATPQSDIDEYFVPLQNASTSLSVINPPDFSKPLLPQVLESYLKADKYYAVTAGMLWYEASAKPDHQIALWSDRRQDQWAP